MFQLIPFQTPGDCIKLDEYLVESDEHLQTGTAETSTAETQGEEVAPRALPGSQGMPE